MKRTGIVLLIVVAGIAIASYLVASGWSDGHDDTSPERSPFPKPHGIMLIVIDTLRADRLGCYGYERPTSPHLDKLARESVLFETVMAQSAFTLVSHKSLFTSQYPLELARATTNADLETLVALPDHRGYLVSTFRDLETPLLIDGLRAEGYGAAAFTDGVWMARGMGFEEYFDVYNDERGHLRMILPRAFRWLSANRDAPFFLFVHTFDTHAPYVCQEPFNSMFCPDHSRHISLARRCNQVNCGEPALMQIDLSEADIRAIGDHYDGQIACADTYLDKCFTALREMKLYDEMLLIVTSDHGESLGEHDQIGHGGLYLEQLMVPLIIKFPASWGVAPARIKEPVELVDVMATVYHVCGLGLPEGSAGRSLLPLLDGGSWSRRYLIAQTAHQEGRGGLTNAAKRAILEPGRWLLIHDATADAMELFDLQADPKGFAEVAEPKPPEGGRLLKTLMAQDPRGGQEEFTEAEAPELTEEQLRQLRSLGYIGD